MNPTHSITNPSPFRPVNVVLAAFLIALFAAVGCSESRDSGGNQGGIDADYEERRFQFVRAGKLLLRLDSQLGVVWKVDENGDGGWVMLGATPDDGDEPNWNGRYALFSLKPSGFGGAPRLLRGDRATGRSWMALAEDDSRWSPIQEGLVPNEAEGSPAAGEPAAEDESEPISLTVLSKEVIENSPGEETEKIAVVLQALEKDGLAVEFKVWAVRQLAVFSPEAALPPLLDSLGSEHPEVVVAAIHSLKELGRPKAIPKILALSQHPDPRVRAAVQEVVVPVP
jgi:hypothetical protein